MCAYIHIYMYIYMGMHQYARYVNAITASGSASGTAWGMHWACNNFGVPQSVITSEQLRGRSFCIGVRIKRSPFLLVWVRGVLAHARDRRAESGNHVAQPWRNPLAVPSLTGSAVSERRRASTTNPRASVPCDTEPNRQTCKCVKGGGVGGYC